MSEIEPETCEVCDKPFAVGETCKIDIELGKVHAECAFIAKAISSYEARSALQVPSAPAEMGVGVKLKLAAKMLVKNSLTPEERCLDALALVNSALASLPTPAPDAEKDEIARLTQERDYAQAAAAAMSADVTHLSARTTDLEGQVAALVEGLREGVQELGAILSVKPHSREPNLAARYFEWVQRVESAHGRIRDDLDRALLARIQPALNGQEAGR